MKWGGPGCAALFFLPFALFGAAALVIGVTRLPTAEWGLIIPFLILGTIFSIVGVGGIVLAVKGLALQKRAVARQVEHPDEPWQWREDWAVGRIPDKGAGRMIGAWIFAGFWNLVSAPGAYFGVREALDGNTAAWLVLLFPAVGVGLLTWAIRETLRHRRYGKSMVILTTVPGVLGGAVRGAVACRLDPRAAESVRLTLSCIRRVTRGRGDSRRTVEDVLWQEHADARPEPVRHGAALRFAFDVPRDLPPSDPESSSDYVVWRLDAGADVPGVDYAARFELPVFPTDASQLPEGEGGRAKNEESGGRESWQPGPDAEIPVRTTASGIEVTFRAARHPGVAAMITVFFLIFGGIAVLLPTLGAPLLMAIAFGFFGLILFFAMVHAWSGRSTVRADRGGVGVDFSMLLYHSTKHVTSDELDDVIVDKGMQSGSTRYWDLKAKTKAGKSVVLGRSVRDRREADWIARQLRRVLGRDKAGKAGQAGQAGRAG